MAAKKNFTKLCIGCNFQIGVYGFKKHVSKCDGLGPQTKRIKIHKKRTAWNKGLTKESDIRVKKGAQTYSLRAREGKIKRTFIHTVESKKKLSLLALRRHREGTMPHWTRKERSYAEKFFDIVISNELIDKNFKPEYRIGRYNVDYAWPHKMKILEVDGEQHYTKEGISYDLIRDNFITRNGWEILRFRWSLVCKNKKLYIEKIKQFIDMPE